MPLPVTKPENWDRMTHQKRIATEPYVQVTPKIGTRVMSTVSKLKSVLRGVGYRLQYANDALLITRAPNDFTVAGAGLSAVNGVYVKVGKHNDRWFGHYSSQLLGSLFMSWHNGVWRIKSRQTAPDQKTNYYACVSDEDMPPKFGWQVAGNIMDPIVSVGTQAEWSTTMSPPPSMQLVNVYESDIVYYRAKNMDDIVSDNTVITSSTVDRWVNNGTWKLNFSQPEARLDELVAQWIGSTREQWFSGLSDINVDNRNDLTQRTTYMDWSAAFSGGIFPGGDSEGMQFEFPAQPRNFQINPNLDYWINVSFSYYVESSQIDEKYRFRLVGGGEVTISSTESTNYMTIHLSGWPSNFPYPTTGTTRGNGIFSIP